MVKLKDAKCPNCGANIQVNDKLENTICQYCGSQVVIEEAIEKYKLEISGKVEVDGIKGRKSKFEQAMKHIEIEEYNDAKELLLEIVGEDHFDTEAYIQLLKIRLIQARDLNLDSILKTSEYTDSDNWEIVNRLKDCYERVLKIDKSGLLEKELKECTEDLEKFKEFLNKVKKQDKLLNEYKNRLNNCLQKVLSAVKNGTDMDIIEDYYNNVIDKYFNTLGYVTYYYGNSYTFSEIYKISRDGIVEGKYYCNNTYETLYSTQSSTCLFEEIEEKVKNVEAETDGYIQNWGKEKENPEAEKEEPVGGFVLGVILLIACFPVGIVYFIWYYKNH